MKTRVNASQYPEFRQRLTTWYDTIVTECDAVWDDPNLSLALKSQKFSSILESNVCK